jgi:hypothetical protein
VKSPKHLFGDLIESRSIGLASTGDRNGLFLVALGVTLWLVGHLLYRMRRGVWKSVLAERACFAATAFWRSSTGRQPGKMQS